MLVSLEISMLILFPKLEPTWLLQWSLVPLPSYCQNLLHPVSQMETSHFHISPPISTVPFLQFFRWNWSSHAPYALSFPPSLRRSKPLTIVVSQLKENFSCSACEHLLHDLNHLFLDCLDLWLCCLHTNVWLYRWVSAKFRCFFIPRKGSGGTTTQSSRFKNNNNAVCFTDC